MVGVIITAVPTTLMIAFTGTGTRPARTVSREFLTLYYKSGEFML